MQRPNHLKAEILQWICNGFKSQKPEIELLINEHKPALICLQETRTNSANEYSIPGYNILTQGGVAIAEEWNTSYNNDRFIDRITIRLRIGHTKLTHQHYAKKEDPASCSTCGVPITVQHILIRE